LADHTSSLIVALTGGIASGKTAAADEFARLGAAVIDADQIARDVVEPEQPALAKIISEFGADCLDSNGRLDRARLREIVFADPAKRKRLEVITHPAIHEELTRRSARAQGPYQIHVIPLLVEGGRAKNYKHIVLVDCDENLQLTRLTQRDHCDETQAHRILAAQATRQQRLAVATNVIRNDGGLNHLHEQVRRLHTQYLQLSTQSSS
jgi:dephospho-CoA kinase